MFWQDINTSIDKYRDDFEAYVEIIKSYGVTIGYEKGHITEEVKKIAADPDNPTTNEWKDAKMIVKKEC